MAKNPKSQKHLANNWNSFRKREFHHNDKIPFYIYLLFSFLAFLVSICISAIYFNSDVCGYAKVLIFLQITTVGFVLCFAPLMYADTQRY